MVYKQQINPRRSIPVRPAQIITALALLLLLCSCLSCSNSDAKIQENKTAGIKTAAFPEFTAITNRAGLGEFQHQNGAFGKMWFPEQMPAGCAFIDYDNDGWLDVLLVGGGEIAPNTLKHAVEGLWLYQNNQDGTFTLQTEAAGLAGVRAYGTGITAADYDNDGDADIFFTTLHQNMLFQNDGGVFTDVSDAAGLGKTNIWSSSAMFFDADKDGWLDLYVANYAQWTPETDIWCSLDGKTKVYCGPAVYTGVPSEFYRNNGDGTFSNQTEAAGFLPAPGKSLGVVEMDVNSDGWPDFAVANDGERDLLYLNNGDGTFTEKGTASGVAYSEYGEARAGMGIDAGVVDSKGNTTLFVGNFSKEMIGVYRYTGSGWFIDRAAVSRIGRPSLLMLTFGLFLIDADFDSDLDLFVANGHVYPERTKFEDGIAYRQPAQLFRNNGEGVFEDISDSCGAVFQKKIVARGAAYGDYDRDGDPDILLIENGGRAHLWQNNFRSPQFLRVSVEGKESNRDGISTRIVAISGGKHQERRIRTGSSYLSHSETTATFGLGQATVVDSLLIYWPGGAVDELFDVKANQEIKVTEGTEGYKTVPLSEVEPIAAK